MRHVWEQKEIYKSFLFGRTEENGLLKRRQNNIKIDKTVAGLLHWYCLG
jgi:hypothetical protein